MPYKVNEIYPWGRSYEEYVDMFQLSEKDLTCKILGCADGPAAFNASATKLGYTVISCDPIYQFTSAQINERIHSVSDEITRKVTAAYDDFNWSYRFTSPDDLKGKRLSYMQTFIEDYESNYLHKRYLPCELPTLPFKDDEFDLALVSNLLFLYDSVLSFDFHLKSIIELSRVAKEVRIFPLTSTSGGESKYTTKIYYELQRRKYQVENKPTGYTFIKEAKSFMSICKRGLK